MRTGILIGKLPKKPCNTMIRSIHLKYIILKFLLFILVFNSIILLLIKKQTFFKLFFFYSDRKRAVWGRWRSYRVIPQARLKYMWGFVKHFYWGYKGLKKMSLKFLINWFKVRKYRKSMNYLYILGHKIFSKFFSLEVYCSSLKKFS